MSLRHLYVNYFINMMTFRFSFMACLKWSISISEPQWHKVDLRLIFSHLSIATSVKQKKNKTFPQKSYISHSSVTKTFVIQLFNVWKFTFGPKDICWKWKKEEEEQVFRQLSRLTTNLSIFLSAFSFISVHMLLLNDDDDDRVETFVK